MKEKTLNEVLTELQVSLENDDLTGAIKVIESLRPADQADLMEELDHRSGSPARRWGQ